MTGKDFDITKTISRLIDQAQHEASRQLELHLLKFFGSYEAAVENAHMYVLTCDVSKIVNDDENAKYCIEEAWTIRLKTQEELDGE